ncbi:MAG: TIGR04211 family SH3 domain-containing protein [Myxococcota bacterium]
MAGATWIRRAYRRYVAFGIAAAIGLGAIQNTAAAEEAEARRWVRDEVRLNLRTGPGEENRIVGVLKTGSVVEVLKQKAAWTEVRLEDGREGWIPVGYLAAEPPAALRVADLENRLSDLNQTLESLRSEAADLRARNKSLASDQEKRQVEVERLSAGAGGVDAEARWTEWIIGASILVVGMFAGAILHRNAKRYPNTRIRI